MVEGADWIGRWRLREVRPLAETPTSRLWRALSPDHGAVVLKVLTPRGAEERHGFRLMEACAGRGMVRAFAVAEGACLMADLPGPSAGDLVRQGRDAAATEVLATIAAAIRAVPPPQGLIPLETYLAALFCTDPAVFPAAARVDIGKAVAVARHLLDSAPAPVALHGDLHHDNVLMGPEGWCAIDAKGLVGDPAFEMANSFRNPWDRQDLARDPARALRLAQTCATRSGLDRARLLDWAFVQVAVSACWFVEGGGTVEDDLALLPMLAALREGGGAGG